MKKKLICFLGVLLLMMSLGQAAFAQTVNSGENYSFDDLFGKSVIIKESNGATLVNGAKSDTVKILNRNNRTLVPIRFVAEKLSANVDWDQKTKTVTVVYGDKTVKLKENSKTMTINGKTAQMDVAAVIVSGTTYLPLRAVGEALDKTVDYSSDYRMIAVYSGNSNVSDFGIAYRLANVLFDGKQLVYFDESNLMYLQDGKMYIMPKNSTKGEPVEKQNGYVQKNDIAYLVTGVSAAMGGQKGVYAIKGSEVKPLFGGQIRSYAIDDNGDYMYVVENVWGNALLDKSLRMEYNGNLYRQNLRKLAAGEKSEAEYLGVKGFVYGMEPTYQDENHPAADKSWTLFTDKKFTPVLKDGYVYINGVQFMDDMSECQPTYGKYKIAITDRSHEKIGEADK